METPLTLPARQIERLARNLHVGEWLVENERPLATLLGSCVAVCLYDTGASLGGMNHFLLPTRKRSNALDDDSLLAGDACMTALFNGMIARGASRHRMKAKVFGGGAVIATSSNVMAIGERNAAFAREWLENERIPLVASDLNGPWARKVLLVPNTGEAYCRRIPSAMLGTQRIEEEAQAWADKQRHPPAKNVELF
ncbi:chemotaxis protein CheD [Rhodocyclus tenuis]|uniref:Probable chemoreceptor glutamine deamidase CheD n=2 Tax=Rhodocyclus TaxID=1064 RepID=A0A6L5JWM3_RHOTE|nr:chemotaxis protein CheD [Rhodocyclus gracilis]MQY51763.1 chemotaxis protein CheD [Rhodocyclus gracilis]MRD73243.1 chemotaxis protein CheD [Rhodocyclus gracilis]NJA88976.1 chemotaxis protein CheD [Rhodocyclus gracilis]